MVVVFEADVAVCCLALDVMETFPVKIPQSAPKATGGRLNIPVGKGYGENCVDVPLTETTGIGGKLGAGRQSLASHWVDGSMISNL